VQPLGHHGGEAKQPQPVHLARDPLGAASLYLHFIGGFDIPETDTIKGISDYLGGKIIDSGQEILEDIAKLFKQPEPAECPVSAPSSTPHDTQPSPTPGAPQPGQPRYRR
jgi:hypothetical protein